MGEVEIGRFLQARRIPRGLDCFECALRSEEWGKLFRLEDKVKGVFHDNRATVVLVDVEDLAFFFRQIDGIEVVFDVRTSESVDRLLAVADHDEGLPSAWAEEGPDDFPLFIVSVLGLVHEAYVEILVNLFLEAFTCRRVD